MSLVNVSIKPDSMDGTIKDDVSHHGVPQTCSDPEKHKDRVQGDHDQLNRPPDPLRSELTPYHAQGAMVRTILNQEDFAAQKTSIPPSDSGHHPSQHRHTHGEVPPIYTSQDKPSHKVAPGPPALVLLGNAGAGKSTLLTQLGGKFKSGAVFRKGFTKEISEQVVKVDGKDVCLMDVPGLFEPNDKETQFNAEQLDNALSRKYIYRLYFVLRADNRGPDDKEMVMMSKISECVRKVDGSRVSFGVIVNQIRSDDVYEMYRREMAHDNFQSMFRGLNIPGLTFDIKIDSVLMLWFDELGLNGNRFRDELVKEIHKHPAAAIELVKGISFCNDDLKLYQARHLSSASGAISEPTSSGSLVHLDKPITGGYPPERCSQPSWNKKGCHSKVYDQNKSKGYFESLKEMMGMSDGSSSHRNTGASGTSSSHRSTGASGASSSQRKTGTSGINSSHNTTEMSECFSNERNTDISDDSLARRVMS
ncbi:hypothetical protein CPB97_006993 [Podila verticillata]|nr:hypothetical protein CPB97_006993 [Podila verticillata]